MSSPFATGAPIPGLLWSSLEDTLQANMIRLAKDIAKTLGQPEAPLLQAIKASPIRPYIFEESEEKEVDMRCGLLCQHPATPLFIQPCGKPVLWSGATAARPRCAEHAYSQQGAVNGGLKKLQALEGCANFASDDGTVYDAENNAVGRYDRDSKRLTTFVVYE